MNLLSHGTCHKAGASARSPLAPAPAPAAGAGAVLSAMRTESGGDGQRVDGKESSGAPLPGAPNVGLWVPADPYDSNTRVHAKIFPLPIHVRSPRENLN